MRRLVILGLVAACGRIGFDDRIDTVPPPACAGSYTLQPPGLTSRYRIVRTGAVWLDAEATCEADGAHLVVIESAAENTWVQQNVAGFAVDIGSTWIGAGDAVHEGTYAWVTGAALGYTNFQNGEPNDFGGYEDCFQMYTTGLWNDTGCRDAAYAYACECDLVRAAVPATYCDTSTETDCGECGHVCLATQTCQGQICMP